MFKLIAATLAALFIVFTVFGDESRRPAEVARADEGPLSGFDFSDWIAPVALAQTRVSTTDISEGEAIAMALEAGRAHREARKSDPLIGTLVAAVEAPAEPGSAQIDETMWYVTGTTVNVRSGPSTANPVVTQVSLGDAAEVLGDPTDGWVEIRPEGSEITGWIAARFLDPTAPG